MAQLRNRGTNVWQIQIYLGKDGEGKKKFDYETFYGTKPQAKLRASELEVNFKAKNGSSKATIMTVGELLEKWLLDIPDRIEPSTHERYQRHAETLDDLVGDLQLYALDSIIIVERLKDLHDKGLAPRTIKNYYRTLSTALNWGAGKRYLSRDVIVGIKPPMIQHISRNVLKSNELKLFIQTAKIYKHYLPLKILALTGMRLGELIGLKWKNLSRNGKIKIVEAVNSRARYLKDTKTKNSRREIQLDLLTTEELNAHKKLMSSSGRAGDDDFVFQSDDGQFLRYQAIYTAKEKVLKKAGLNHIRLHDLRHGVGSLMLDNGSSIVTVAEQLGQVPATTAAIYSHSLRRGSSIADLLL